jgi:hypothetical protein
VSLRPRKFDRSNFPMEEAPCTRRIWDRVSSQAGRVTTANTTPLRRQSPNPATTLRQQGEAELTRHTATDFSAYWTTQEFSDLSALAMLLGTGLVGAQPSFPPQTIRAPERAAGSGDMVCRSRSESSFGPKPDPSSRSRQRGSCPSIRHPHQVANAWSSWTPRSCVEEAVSSLRISHAANEYR